MSHVRIFGLSPGPLAVVCVRVASSRLSATGMCLTRWQPEVRSLPKHDSLAVCTTRTLRLRLYGLCHWQCPTCSAFNRPREHSASQARALRLCLSEFKPASELVTLAASESLALKRKLELDVCPSHGIKLNLN